MAEVRHDSSQAAHGAVRGIREENLKGASARTHVDTPNDEELRTRVQQVLLRASMKPASPGPDDLIVLLRGFPVVPWIPLRPSAVVWTAWIRWLQDRQSQWAARVVVSGPENHLQNAPAAEALALTARAWETEWETWQREHIALIDVHRPDEGSEQLAHLLAKPVPISGDIHLVGHSVGGTAVLAYLAHRRADRLPRTRRSIRSALALDAAVRGFRLTPGGHVSGKDRASLGGLGAWASQQDITLLTISNECDWWSHRPIADIPYLGLRLGTTLPLRAQFDGQMHDQARRSTALIEALWGSPT